MFIEDCFPYSVVIYYTDEGCAGRLRLALPICRLRRCLTEYTSLRPHSTPPGSLINITVQSWPVPGSGRRLYKLSLRQARVKNLPIHLSCTGQHTVPKMRFVYCLLLLIHPYVVHFKPVWKRCIAKGAAVDAAHR